MVLRLTALANLGIDQRLLGDIRRSHLCHKIQTQACPCVTKTPEHFHLTLNPMSVKYFGVAPITWVPLQLVLVRDRPR